MLINEVEHIVGLSKKSIRYYEEEGLINPKRKSENDYRIYTEKDINKLKIIKFLRELGVPIRELKLLNENKMSLQECMNERLKKINNEEEKFEKIKNMCIEISKSNESFTSINITTYFEKINILNKEGFTMRNIKSNKSKKIIGAILSSTIFGAFLLFFPILFTYFQFTETEQMPWILYWFLIIMFIFPIIGIIYNLIIRIKEINGGEEDEASKY